MDASVSILRQLWRHRAVVAVFALVAVLLGGLIAYRPSFPPQSRKYHVGTAMVHILVDTPASQVVEVSPKGSETLGQRASLLANLMSQGEVKAEVARRAGLRPNQLLAVSDASIDPKTVTPQQTKGPKVHLLTIGVVTNDAGEELPIIGVQAQAPDAAKAAALANAAVSGLQDFLTSKAAVERIPDARRLTVRGLGAAQAREISRGPGPLLAFVVMVFLFAALCGVLLFILALAETWRAVSDDEARDVDWEAGEAAPLEGETLLDGDDEGVPDQPWEELEEPVQLSEADGNGWLDPDDQVRAELR